MTIANVNLPDTKRVYNVRMPDGVGIYNMLMPSGPASDCDPCDDPNIFPQPNNFSNWTVIGSAAVIADQDACPGGTVQDADNIDLPDGSALIHPRIFGLTPLGTVTMSLWVKPLQSSGFVRLINADDTNEGFMWLECTPTNNNTWVLLAPGEPDVTVANAFTANASGELQVGLDGAPTAVVYNAWCIKGYEGNEFIRAPCTLSPFGTSEVFNAWYSTNNVQVAANGGEWDVTDDSSSYESLEQLSQVPTTAVGGIPTNSLEITVGKESVDDHFLYVVARQYESYILGSGSPEDSLIAVAYNMVTGAFDERINAGGQSNTVEDLGTQWKFTFTFDRLKTATVIRTQIYPAGGTTFPLETGDGQGTATIACVIGLLGEISGHP